MLPHNFVEGVRVVAGHEEVDHARARPPLAALTVLGEQKSGGERDRNGLTSAGTLEAKRFPDAVPER